MHNPASYPEPPEGSIVGWGTPLTDCYVRGGGGAAYGYLPEECWHEATEAVMDDPCTWADLVRSKAYIPGGPYLLTPTPLKENHA